MRVVSAAALVAAALTVGVGTAGATTFTVHVGPGFSNTFSPSSQSIAVNDHINWVWDSGFHSTTSGSCSPGCTPNGLWDSGQMSGGNFDHQFLAQGTFPYYCSVHGSTMQGTISVGPPTAATFSTFAAGRTRGGVLVRWQTASEVQILGFNVFRQRNDGRYVLLNRDLLLARHATSGFSYSFLDRRAPQTRYPMRYWLQLVDLAGARTWYGPVWTG